MPVLPLRSQSLSSLSCQPGQGKTDYRDSQCKGLLLEVRSSGGRTWYLTYVNKRGQRRQQRLGDLRDLSLSQARQLADRLRSQVAMGEDPAEQQALQRLCPTFSIYVKELLLPHLKLSKRSWQCDQSLLRCHLLPAFGERSLDSISRADVLEFQVAKTEEGLAAGTVYRIMVQLRHAFRLAIDWEVPGVTANPCARVPLPKVNDERQRFLTPDEAHRLVEAMQSSANKYLEAIVIFLLLTGARKREALDAQWEAINWDQRRWFIPITKTGYPRHVPLSDEALMLLSRQRALTADSLWIFPNPGTGKPFRSIFYAWNKARERAGLIDLRVHDLRHSFASFLINDGRSLYEVQQILGHRSSSMTQRYAHLTNDRLVEATNSVTRALGTSIYIEPAS